MSRSASIERNTKETDIRVTLELDGTGQAELDTGIGFFDHMLDGFARHGLFDLNVYVDGDLDVDCHHTVRIRVSFLEMRSRKLWGQKVSADMEAVSFPWMRHWCCVQWICPADLIMYQMRCFLHHDRRTGYRDHQ